MASEVKPLPAENNLSESNSSGNKPRYSGGKRRGGGSGVSNDRSGGGNGSSQDHDGNDSIGRRKKPELEHYKPGAFGSRKPDDDSGNNDSSETNEINTKQKHHRGGGGNGKHYKANNVDQVSEKVDSLSLQDSTDKTGTARRNNRKKPEQAHYVAKKSEDKPKVTPSPNSDEKSSHSKDSNSQNMESTSKPDGYGDSKQSSGNNRKKNKNNRGGGNNGRDRRKEASSRESNHRESSSSNKNELNTKEHGGSRIVDESQRNGHSVESDHNNFQQRPNSHQNRGGSSRRGGPGGNTRGEEHEDHLPPRLRQKDEPNNQQSNPSSSGGRTDQGNRNRGGSHNKNRRTSPNYNNSSKGPDSRNSSARKGSPPIRHDQDMDRRKDRRGGGYSRNHNADHYDRESSSPMVSSEARSPSPNGGRRDSASSRNNRRSYSPHRNIVSPTNNRRGGSRDLRGRGGGSSNRRYEYHSRDTPDRRFNDDYGNRDYGTAQNRGGNGDRSGRPQTNKVALAPRFQKSRYWTKDSHQSGGVNECRADQDYNSGGGHRSHQPRRSDLRDYEVDDHRTFDYEKDDDDDDTVGPHINDWGLEVEEEEERMSHLHDKQQQSLPDPKDATTAGRGIIRLPPDAMAGSSGGGNGGSNMSGPGNSSSSSDWRAHRDPQQQQSNHHYHPPHHSSSHMHHQHQQQQQPHHVSNVVEDSNNPAWRGVPGGDRNPTHQQQQRYLFDHRNPNKPIPAQNRSSGNRPPGPEVTSASRFPLDPRFVPPPPPTVMGPRMSGYRPPFPTPQASHPITDPKALAAEGGEATKILGANELRLRAIVQSGGPQKLCQLWHQDVLECRHTIMRTFKHLLQNNLVFCAKSDVEFYVWKICFYNIVTTLKLWLQGGTIPQSERQVVEDNVTELLNEGLEFFSEMLETLDDTYHIKLDQYYDVLEPRSTDTTVRCALVSAQKCLLCLGDLARYKEMIQNTSNYGKSRQYYQKASHIDTRNAKPFNQLAILAWTAKRKFEAVYYHMRCLQTKTPVKSSRQSLIEIFEDIRKRWDISEKKRLEERAQRKKEADSERDRMHLIKGTRLRKEIWIRPDGGRRLHRTTSAQEGAPDSEEAELKEMSTTDLNRRFNNAFLHLIGTLYTNINIDAFPISMDLLQKEFRILLSRSPLPIDCKRLVQIMALNMFIIEHTKMKSGDQEHYVSVTQNYALQLAFEMFGILVECCNNLLLSFIPPNNESQTIFNDDDLPNLLSAVKVWCDWLLGNNDTWYPVICDEPFNELAKLATHLEKLKPVIAPILEQCINEDQYFSLPPDSQKKYGMIKLDEDAVLCGFSPWSLGVNWSIYRRYAPKTIPVTLLQDARRLDAINFCIDFLEGLEPPILKWSPPDNAHISLVEIIIGSTTADKVNAKLTHMLSREQDILDETYSDDESKSDKKLIDQLESVDRSSKIGQLKIRKEELERRRKEEEETRKLQQQILSEHVSVTLEVCPKYVVPDTNCFVDFLPEISRLVSQSPFQMRVPLVVLKELDGLAKGARSTKYVNLEHAAMVAENAHRALTFLKDRPPNTKCVTSRGTVLPSLGVTTEDDYNADKNNDDLILDACLNLAMHKEEFQGNMRVVYRDLVLLTDDRNLKLKAHMTDIPVNKLSDFIHWAYSTSKDV